MLPHLIFSDITFPVLMTGKHLSSQLQCLDYPVNSKGKMENILTRYLRGQLLPTDLKVHYHVGSAFSGETDFHLHGDGTYQLWSTVTQNRQRREYSGQLNTKDVHELVQMMLSVRLWEVKHISPERGRDNPEARITIISGGESFPVILWVSEIDEVPAFDEVQEKILMLVRLVSANEVLEVGR
jgi:hypothetical protein